MSKFHIVKKLDLSDCGAGWDGCFLEFKVLGYRDINGLANLKTDTPEDRKASEEYFDSILSKNFIAGKAFDGTDTVEVLAEDILDLPKQIVDKAIELVVGRLDPK